MQIHHSLSEPQENALLHETAEKISHRTSSPIRNRPPWQVRTALEDTEIFD
jgi:hypothetical protein